MDEEDERTVELSSIEAIYPELIRKGSYTVCLDIPTTLDKPLRVVFPAATPLASPNGTLGSQQNVNLTGKNRPEVYFLRNLPPVTATINLPVGYPSESPPEVSLVAQESWIPQTKLDELQDAARREWSDMGHDAVVYSYITSIIDAGANCFDLAANGTLDIPQELKVVLLDYDAKVKKALFDSKTFDCQLCLEPKRGSECYGLQDCGHVSCVSCLQDYYNNCITEGDVNNVTCIEPTCGQPPAGPDGRRRKKKPKPLQPGELLQIPIPAAQVQRYVKIQRKQKLEAKPDTKYCPRKWCQGPARVGDKDPLAEDNSDAENDEQAPRAPLVAPQPVKEANGEADDKIYEEDLPPLSERLAICIDCGFAFCYVCSSSWHGEFGRCNTRLKAELSREEQASEEYLKKHSTSCPICYAVTQKSMGCNHMTCRVCETHFCYLCSARLDKQNPYQHYNVEGKGCYYKLWDLEAGDGVPAE